MYTYETKYCCIEVCNAKVRSNNVSRKSWWSSKLQKQNKKRKKKNTCSVTILYKPTTWGVPQGSNLSPLFLNLLPFGHIISRSNIYFNFYAEDMQIYLPANPRDTHCFNWMMKIKWIKGKLKKVIFVKFCVSILHIRNYQIEKAVTAS